MAQPVIQSSFNSGEWAPHLWGRVDIARYHSGAAILENWFVDYRGGASTRGGTKYVIKAYKPATAVRLIGFQASILIGFVLEFGDQYIRFHRNGAPVLETQILITGATKANPCVVSVVNTWAVGDWVYIQGVGGMTELNGKYYRISARTAGTITLEDLFGVAVNSTGFGTFTAGGSASRVYTVVSPYAAADLSLLKFSQNVSTLFITHPSYVPYSLTYTAPANWLLAPIVFGSTVSAPTGISISTTLLAGHENVCYAYCVTAVDSFGQESAQSAIARLNFYQDLRTTVATNTMSWTGVSGAASYNIYKSDVNVANPVPDGVPFGYIGNCTGTAFIDSNIAADFSQGPPTPKNPFAPGSTVNSVTVTVPGSYTVRPTATFAAPGGGGTTATGATIMSVVAAVVAAGGAGYVVGERITLGNNTVLEVATVAAGAVATVTIVNPGVYNSALPANPVPQTSSSAAGVGATFTLGWGLLTISITNPGSGYSVAPAITFSAGAAAATAVLGPASAGNPSVSTFFQQRFVLAATQNNPQIVYLSQTGNYFNYDISNPIQPDDAITANIVSGQLNNIKALIPQPGGLIALSDGASFLINGGSLGSPVTPTTITANAQSFLGCNDMPPIVVNYDILYVQSKGSSVRDASYNFYANVFTGSDISVLASHLFFGYRLLEWAWAEEPYKIVWAVRSDGQLLSLTFLKEQEFTAWTHHVTQGSFQSVATIVELATDNFQNFLYCVVEREVRGQNLKYIEYMPERIYTNGVEDALCVDCAYVYSGAPATTFSGATALAGLTVTGLADGVVLTPFVMPTDGTFTLAVAASKVSVGLPFTCKLQTLPLDTGEPTIQSKMKKIPAVTIRVTETLGLKIGTTFDNAVPMKDLVRGNVGSDTNEVVTDLVTGDAMTTLDPKWQEQGTFCILQDQPLPASVLAIMPELTVGDTPK